MTSSFSSSSRRFQLKAFAIAMAVCASPFLLTTAHAQAKEKLVIVSWGGTWGDAMKETLFKPFEAETGIVVRNAKDIEFNQVRVNTKTGPSLSIEKSERITVNGLLSAKPLPAIPLIRLTNVKDALLQNSWPFAGTQVFLEVKGAATQNIQLKNNTLGDAAIKIGDDVKKEEVKQ